MTESYQQMLKESQINYKNLFSAMPGNVMILHADEPSFTIADANLSYYQATGSDSSIIGKPLFVAFPDNPGIAQPSGVSNLLASLTEVIRTRRPHEMKIQRYDTPKPGGGFTVKYWKPLNVPLLGDKGEVSYIIHHVKDVTDLVLLRKDLEQMDIDSQRLISEAVTTTQELERLEISQELHDNISQLLNAARLYLANALNTNPPPKKLVQSAFELVADTLQAIKVLGSSLTSYPSSEVLFTREIETMLQQARELLNIEVRSNIQVGDNAIPIHIATPMLRIIREQLSNVIRHANPTLITLDLFIKDNTLHLTICDNGIGFDLANPCEGMGLRNMKSRVAMMNGEISIEAAPGAGCTIRITVPFG